MCQDCKKEISERQIEDADWYMEKRNVNEDLLDIIWVFDGKFRKVKEEIDKGIDKVNKLRFKTHDWT